MQTASQQILQAEQLATITSCGQEQLFAASLEALTIRVAPAASPVLWRSSVQSSGVSTPAGQHRF